MRENREKKDGKGRKKEQFYSTLVREVLAFPLSKAAQSRVGGTPGRGHISN